MLLDLKIRITYNNVIASINDLTGKTLSCISSGILKYKGREKINNVAIDMISFNILKNLKKKKCKEINIYFTGNTQKRWIIIKHITNSPSKIKINKILDLTSIPHNGCRLKKKPRK